MIERPLDPQLADDQIINEPEFERDYTTIDQVYRIPTHTVEKLLSSLDQLEDIKAELDRYLVDSIMSGDNPEEK